MADWTNITDSQVDPDAPLTSELAYAWRDNPVAIAEGAVGAPRIAPGALTRVSPGDEIRMRLDGEISSTALQERFFAFAQKGTVRVFYSHRASTNGGTATLFRRRVGVQTTLASDTNTSTYVTRTVDVDVLPGDVLVIRNIPPIGGNTVYLRNCRVGTDGGDLFPGSECPLDGNTYNA